MRKEKKIIRIIQILQADEIFYRPGVSLYFRFLLLVFMGMTFFAGGILDGSLNSKTCKIPPLPPLEKGGNFIRFRKGGIFHLTK